jgi:uncharacterized HAD superfamily protein
MKKKLKCGFDIDDTCFPTTTHILENLKKEFPENDIDVNNIVHWGMAECLQLPETQVNSVIYNTIKDTIFPLRDLCFETLHTHSEFYDYYFVTSRNESLYDHTIENLEITFGDLFKKENLFFSGEKYKTILENEIDLFTDDRAKIVKEILEYTSCYPIIYERPWNLKLGNLVRRVRDWTNIYYILLRFKDGKI